MDIHSITRGHIMLAVGFTNTHKTLQFHVGDTIEFNEISNTHMNVLDFVQADGDELNLILDKVKNLPQTNNRVQIWYGDHAKFICANVTL